MRLCLVTMPWESLEVPSLPLGLLTAVVRERRPNDDVRTVFGSLRWAEFVLDRTKGDVTPDDYLDLVESGLFHGLGDWVFTSALYPGAAWPMERYDAHPASGKINDGPARTMRALAPEFVRLCASDVLAGNPDVVGLTSTFMQNVPSLALADELKRQRPDVRVVLGGGNCDGPMGPALHRNFPSLDYVAGGEGEELLPALLGAIEEGEDPSVLAAIGGLCWRRRDGQTVANPQTAEPLGMDKVPKPDFDEYFAVIQSSPLREYVEPKLLHEAARGCWWGQRKHCTFCGLNGSTMAFRSKPAERVWAELEDDIRRHQVLDVLMVDNIMDMHYIGTLLPRLAESGWDLRVHYEVKSNLRRDHVRAMRDAGVVHIQPGIESLSTRVLKLMDKGVDAVTNVRLLRDGEDLRVTTPWNYLYGFPGEADDDYLSVVVQMRNLYHLQPPRIATRVALERFSPFHQRPELGFAFRRPARFYDHVYDLPVSELMDLVFIFDSEPAGITGEVEQVLLAAVGAWQDAYFTSTLTCTDEGDELVIADRRAGREPSDHVLREPWHVLGHRLLSDGLGPTSLAKALAPLDVGSPSVEEVEEWIAWLNERGLVFGDAGRFVTLATGDVSSRVPVVEWR